MHLYNIYISRWKIDFCICRISHKSKLSRQSRQIRLRRGWLYSKLDEHRIISSTLQKFRSVINNPMQISFSCSLPYYSFLIRSIKVIYTIGYKREITVPSTESQCWHFIIQKRTKDLAFQHLIQRFNSNTDERFTNSYTLKKLLLQAMTCAGRT